MTAPLIVVPFAIELTVLITTIAPLAFAGRFERRPNLGMTLWLTSFLLAFISTLVALAISVWSVFDTWRELEKHSQPLWHTIFFSFAPWLILGLAGISMALVAQKLDPIRELRRSDSYSRQLPSSALMNFHGVEVRVVNLPIWLAFTSGVGRTATIYVSDLAVRELSAEQFEAILWHERAHAVHWHNALKSLVRLIRLLGGLMLASHVLTREIDRLCELAADAPASRKLGSKLVAEARSRFE